MQPKTTLRNAVWLIAVVAFVVALQSCAAGKKKLPPETDFLSEENLPEEEAFLEETGDEGLVAEDDDANPLDSIVDEDEYYAGDDENSALIANLRRWIIQGNYDQALRASEGHNNLTVKYYRGITYYHMMFFRDRYSTAERVGFRDNAIRLLRQVGYESPNDYFKAKGLLWHAMAVHLNHASLQKKRLALDSLWRIQKTRLKDTSSYNDSILYMADIFVSMGYYPQAIANYKKVARVSKANDLVYDAVRKRFSPASEASEHGILRVIRITNPNSERLGGSGAASTEAEPNEAEVEEATPTQLEEQTEDADYIDLDPNSVPVDSGSESESEVDSEAPQGE